MFDTFIALFGGIFLAGRQINKKLYQVAVNEKNRNFEAVQNVINDYSLQHTKLMPSFIKDPWQCLDTIADDLCEVFGNDWRVLFRNRRPRDKGLGILTETDGFRDIWNTAYEIYLSYHGQVCTKAYNVRAIMRGVEPDGIDNMQKSIECGRKACHVIEKNMQKKYGDALRLCSIGPDLDKLMWEHYADKFITSKKTRPW